MISHIDHRLQAWGRWVQMDRGLGSKGLSVVWGEPGGGGIHRAVIPIQSIECSRTHDWVMAQAKPDRMLLGEHYCTPRTAIESARRLGISLRTMYKRLHELHTDLAASERHRASK